MVKLNLLVYGYLLLHLSINAHTLQTENIVGGQVARISDYPYHAFVHTQTRQCSGAIITEWHVVTAAHCIIDQDGKTGEIKVAAGLNNLEDPEYKFYANVTTSYVHVDFDHLNNTKTLQGDIAVLKLDRMIPLDDKIMKQVALPEPLSVNNLELFTHTEPILTAYGYNDINISFSKDKRPIFRAHETGDLQYAKTSVLPVDECTMSPLYRTVNFLKVFCSRMKQSVTSFPRGACYGDSGGPLVLKIKGKNTLIGILSCSPWDCDERRVPALYTRVSFYRHFIDRAISGLCDENNVSRQSNRRRRCTLQ